MSDVHAWQAPDRAALARAHRLITLRRWREAIGALGPALTSEATAADAHCLRAQCLFGLSQLREAESAARQALGRQPDSEWAHRLLAIIYLRRRRRRAARKHAEQALRLAPRSPHALHLLAISHLALCRKAKARQAAGAAVAAVPHEPLAQLTLATVAERCRDWDTAERAYREGLRLDPAHTDLTLGLARFLHRRGRKDEAATVYLAAARTDPTDARPRRGLARIGLPLAGAGIATKLLALQGFRVLLQMTGRPTRAALFAGVVLALGAATTTVLRVRGTRNLPDPVREGLKSDHRNAALRWLQVAAAVAVVLAIWAALPGVKGGGAVAAAAFIAFAAGAWFVAHRFWTGPRPGAADVLQTIRLRWPGGTTFRRPTRRTWPRRTP